MSARYDLVSMGRSSIDLYANEIGAPFAEIGSFGAFVGGCPTNVAVGAKRLGLEVALLTAVGTDPVGDFVLAFLDREGVDTRYIPRKSDRRTSAVLLGIEPPDRFPLVFYREGCADIALDIDDVLAAPVDHCRVLLISGTGLSQEPSRSATMLAAERARDAGATVVLDVDFRPDQWHDPRAFGVTLRRALGLVDLVIGTEDELRATALAETAGVEVRDSQISGAQVAGDLAGALTAIFALGVDTVVEKRGEHGSAVHTSGGETREAPPFEVEVCNVLGAGDAFAAGFLYGLLQEWPWERCAAMGNATGAIVVGRQGCANFMPTLDEALALLDSQ